MNEARRAFFETVKEKRLAVPRAPSVSKKRPKRIVMPSDFIDRRTDPNYRAGPVITWRMEEVKQSVDVNGTKLPTWEEFKRMSREERYEFLKKVSAIYTDQQLADMMGTSKQSVTHMRLRYGIEKYKLFNPNFGREAKNEFTDVPYTAVDLKLSLVGTSVDVAHQLRNIAAALEAGGGRVVIISHPGNATS